MRIKISDYSLYADIPKALVLAFVSDLHDCRNEPVLAQIEKINPDAVLVGGDFIHNWKQYERGLEFLSESSKRARTLVSIGNHDRHLGKSISAKVRECGAQLLDNSHISFGGITIGGLSSGYGYGPHKREKITPKPETEWLEKFEKQKGFKLLLCHHPEYYDELIKPLDIDLTISGHAHGGQWRFFGHGVFAPGQGLMPKYTSGLYDGRLLVGRGLGNPYPVPRIFNSPEIIRVRIGRDQ